MWCVVNCVNGARLGHGVRVFNRGNVVNGVRVLDGVVVCALVVVARRCVVWVYRCEIVMKSL